MKDKKVLYTDLEEQIYDIDLHVLNSVDLKSRNHFIRLATRAFLEIREQEQTNKEI